MKRIICFDTSIASSNMGDHIIAESCENQLIPILRNNFIIHFPTHTPISHWYQDFKKFSGGRYRDGADYKFLFGTNLLNSNMFTPTPTWNINIFNNRMAKGIICIGVGLGSYETHANLYTKKLLKSTLNSDYIHSTRDEKTAVFLRNLGFKAINTGCATTWSMSENHCKEIPIKKSDSVIFTLTDYKKDQTNDKLMIEILFRNYSKIYFWIQGVEDMNYLSSLDISPDIEVVQPSLEAYSSILSRDVDYVGTRLHAGIKALQMKRRAIIIEVDNRTSDMKESIKLHTIKRNKINETLESKINSQFVTDIGINEEAIKMWKDQFNEQ